MNVDDPSTAMAPVPSCWGVALVAGPALVLAPLVLRRMRSDLYDRGELRISTAAWMWSGYATFGVLTVAALARKRTSLALPRSARAAASTLTVAGCILTVVAMRCFAGPAQLTGTVAGDLVTCGVYKYSRHPQYTGLLATLVGLAILRRSAGAMALTAGLAATYRAWVPIEEEHLARHFGEPYRRYWNRTSRWAGRPSFVRPQHPHARRTGGST